MPVFFHSEETAFQFREQELFEKWIIQLLRNQKRHIDSVNVIFTSNDYLLKLNQDYLNHNYFTDVITFNYNIESKISGDIFVSIEQVRINSEELKFDFYEELSRVIIHGILHLIGYNDTTEEELIEMRKMEDLALKMLEEIRDGEDI